MPIGYLLTYKKRIHGSEQQTLATYIILHSCTSRYDKSYVLHFYLDCIGDTNVLLCSRFLLGQDLKDLWDNPEKEPVQLEQSEQDIHC